MAKYHKKKKTTNGFTLIEALTVLFIFCVIASTFYKTYAMGVTYIIDSKNRLGAISVANEKMEIIRNLKYESIGTVSGEVSGNIPDDESVSENASGYDVHTLVQYLDDSFDDVYPTDIAPEDYKKVTVTVSWKAGQRSVSLVSRFVPTGLEVASPGDGILMVNVFSDQPGGTGISNSSVHVVNADTGLDTTVQTNSSGSVTLMGDKIKSSIQKYEISLAKSGYETVNTMPPYPITEYTPVDTNASVVVGSMNVINIVQNKLANIKISTIDYLGNAISNIDFHITGGRRLGTEVIFPFSSIYNLDEDGETGSNGEKDFNSISPGQYNFSLSSSVVDYALIETDPILPAALFSDQNLNLKVKLAGKNVTSLLVKVVSGVDGSTPVSGAQVKLSNGSGYDVTQNSSASGAVFFPISTDPFLPGTYDLKVTASGFSDSNSQATINLNQLNTTTITLNAS